MAGGAGLGAARDVQLPASLEGASRRVGDPAGPETGKESGGRQGDVWRGIEVVEQACAICEPDPGETMGNVARRVDGHSWVQPLGCAWASRRSIFSHDPLWMFPWRWPAATASCSSHSEQDPLTPCAWHSCSPRQGRQRAFCRWCTAAPSRWMRCWPIPDVKAVSFVGSARVGPRLSHRHVAPPSAAQCFVGAKNHMVIMPDANKGRCSATWWGPGLGAAGQRCMAISVAVFRGSAGERIPELATEFARVKPGVWHDPEAAYGPLSAPRRRSGGGAYRSGDRRGPSACWTAASAMCPATLWATGWDPPCFAA